MASAKEIRVEPIAAKDARRLVEAFHYSGKIAPNSQVHLGAFLDGRLCGVMQLGPPIDRRKVLPLVSGTKWGGVLELNRMAFSEALPRNSESRALGVARRILKKRYPQLEWLLSYADGTQCGDGTIYRAAGFLLTNIKRNTSLLRLPNGRVVVDKTLNNDPVQNSSWWRKRGAVPLPGFQLRYILPLRPGVRERLTVPILPYSAIERAGAGMYRGQKMRESSGEEPGVQPGTGGSTPTLALHPSRPNADAAG